MDFSFWFFISSGLFLGWSLGANDAANIFGTAVGSRMIRFGTAALICTVFVTLGAVIGGAGAAHTLGTLGGVDRIAGSFMTALAAALAVLMILRTGLIASTTQAIVGAIVGWNFYTGAVTDIRTLLTIITTWVVCPLLAALFAILITKLTEYVLYHLKPHLLTQDVITRLALLIVGAFGAYSLGASNVGNVMGVFTSVSPFETLTLGALTLTSVQQLFLLGCVAIGVGVFTYSKRVMMTVGSGVMELSPLTAWVAVASSSLVLFLFASQGLEKALIQQGLPSWPLVPVSSSQAMIGAVVGIGLLKGGKAINWGLVGRIGCGWVVTPLMAFVFSVVGLFILNEMFHLNVAKQQQYLLSQPVLQRLQQQGVDTEKFKNIFDIEFSSGQQLLDRIERYYSLSAAQQQQVLYTSYKGRFYFDVRKIGSLDQQWFTLEQWRAVSRLAGQFFEYKWQITAALEQQSSVWRLREASRAHKYFNRDIEQKLQYLYRAFELERTAD